MSKPLADVESGSRTVADHKREVIRGATHARPDKREPSDSRPADAEDFQVDFSFVSKPQPARGEAQWSARPRECSWLESGRRIHVCALRFPPHFCHPPCTSWNRLGHVGSDSRSQLDSFGAALRASNSRAQARPMLQYGEIMRAAEKAAFEQEGIEENGSFGGSAMK